RPDRPEGWITDQVGRLGDAVQQLVRPLPPTGTPQPQRLLSTARLDHRVARVSGKQLVEWHEDPCRRRGQGFAHVTGDEPGQKGRVVRPGERETSRTRVARNRGKWNEGIGGTLVFTGGSTGTGACRESNRHC